MMQSAARLAPACVLLVAVDHIECDRRQGQTGGSHQGDLGHRDPCEEGLAEGEELREQLLADGHEVRLAHTAAHARALARARAPDLVLVQAQRRLREALDLVLEIRCGHMSKGVEETEETRGSALRSGGHLLPDSWPQRVPIIVIAGRRSRIDVLRAFEAGADDYLTAPPFYLELRARMRVLLERSCGQNSAPLVRVGTLTIDTFARSVTLDGRRCSPLPRLQYELLLALAREPRRVITRTELARRLWDGETPGSGRALDSHASRLRRALRAESAERWIVSVRGVGYRLR